jgi:hypothetical protein
MGARLQHPAALPNFFDGVSSALVAAFSHGRRRIVLRNSPFFENSAMELTGRSSIELKIFESAHGLNTPWPQQIFQLKVSRHDR